MVVAPNDSGSLADSCKIRLLLAGLFSVSAVAYWGGVGPGDAEQYFKIALDWVEEGPTLGQTHWSLRHLFVLPLVASFHAFGVNEFAATLPNILYAGALVASTYFFARRYFGEIEATASAALIAVSASFMARPLEVEVYGVEIFYIAAAGWLFVASRFESRRLACLFGAGLFSGLAWTIREHTAFLLPAFGIFILSSRKNIVQSAIALGLGFAAVIACEWVIYAISAGDPFYRYKVDLNHRAISSGNVAPAAEIGFLKSALRPFIDLITAPATSPFLLVGVAGALYFRRALLGAAETQRRTLAIFGVLSGAAMFLSSYVFSLPAPRYYPVLTYFLFLLLGWITAQIWRRAGKAPTAAFAAMLVALNAAAADFSRYNEYDEARFLARVALNSSEPIFTDPFTATAARYEMIFLGADRATAIERIIPAKAPMENRLFFKAEPTKRIDDAWCILQTAEPRKAKVTHALIRMTGIGKLAGARVNSVTAKPQPVALARILAAPADFDPATGAPCISSAR